MAQDYNVIDQGIKKIVLDLTTLTNDFVVKDNQNGPRPDLPYISFQKIAEQKMHRNSIVNPDGVAADAIIYNHKRLTVRYTAYGNTAYDLLDDLILGFANEPIMDQIRIDYGISTLSYGPATEAPAITTNVIEERVYIDVILTYISQLVLTGTSGDVIEDVNGSGVLKGAKTGDKNVTFNVDT